MRLANLWHWSYWFDLQALSLSETAFWAFVVWLAIITLAFIILRVFVHRKSVDPYLMRHLARVSRGVLVYGIFSALFFFFRTQETIIIGMRFWYLFATAIVLVWFTWVTMKFRNRYEKDRTAHEERLRRESYFPKGNK